MQPQIQQPFNRPNVGIPTQTFETNFKNLSDQVNNLSNRFNTYGDALLNRLNDVKRSEQSVTSTPVESPIVYPESAIDVEYSKEKEMPVRTPKTPVVQGVKDLINRTVKVYPSGGDGTPIVKQISFKDPPYNDKFDSEISNRSLFVSPTLNMDSRQFNKPKVVIPEADNNPVFNKPQLIEAIEKFNEKYEKPIEPPTEKFNKEIKAEDEEAVEEVVQKVDKNEPKKAKQNYSSICPLCNEGISHSGNLRRHIENNHHNPNLQNNQTGIKYNRTSKKEYISYPTDEINNILTSLNLKP
jgi:hypothetical protein